MNKIKIVNEDLLHIMQTTAKDYRVAEQYKKQNSVPSRRPKTPQEILKSMVKQGITPQFHHKRDDKMHTIDSHYRFRPQSSHGENHSSGIVQRKFAATASLKSRPMTPDVYSSKLNKKSDQIDDINHLKNNIDQVLSQIKQASQLAKLRMLKKYNDYSHKKFGRFWNPHVNSLTKKGFHSRTKPIETQNPTKTRIFKKSQHLAEINRSRF